MNGTVPKLLDGVPGPPSALLKENYNEPESTDWQQTAWVQRLSLMPKAVIPQGCYDDDGMSLSMRSTWHSAWCGCVLVVQCKGLLRGTVMSIFVTQICTSWLASWVIWKYLSGFSHPRLHTHFIWGNLPFRRFFVLFCFLRGWNSLFRLVKES